MSRVVGSPTQGEGPAGTISSKSGRAERSNFTNWSKAFLPCCQQVRKTLAKICCVRAPFAVRFPPQVLRAMAIVFADTFIVQFLSERIHLTVWASISQPEDEREAPAVAALTN